MLHDQLAAELAVGQAALQLFAADQQQRQQQHQQDTHEQQQDALAKLRQQLESCHFAALWGQHSSSSNGSGSSSGSVQEGVGSKQQLLQLLVSTLLVGPLAVVSDVVGQAPAGGGCIAQQLQQQGEDGNSLPQQQQQQQQPCCSVLEQLLQAAVAGVGASQDCGSCDKQQQQQQHGLENVLGLLLSQMPQPCCSLKTDQQATHSLDQQAAGSSAEQGAAAAATGGGRVCSESVAGVQLAAFTRGLCNLLVLRLLSRAPPCECWSWEACLAVTQLLASSEQAAAAAGGLMYQDLSQHPAALQWASTCGFASLGSSSKQLIQQDPDSAKEGQQQQRQQQNMQQQEEGEQGGAAAGGVAQGQQHCTSRVHAGMLMYSRQLQGVLQQLHIAQQALEACHSSSSHSNMPSRSTCSSIPGGSSSRTPVSQIVQSQQQQPQQHQQHHQQQPQQQQRQQEQEEEFAAPSFWRSQLLALYQKSRPSGSGFLQQCFPAIGADNDKPGFWALVSVWRLGWRLWWLCCGGYVGGYGNCVVAAMAAMLWRLWRLCCGGYVVAAMAAAMSAMLCRLCYGGYGGYVVDRESHVPVCLGIT